MAHEHQELTGQEHGVVPGYSLTPHVHGYPRRSPGYPSPAPGYPSPAPCGPCGGGGPPAPQGYKPIVKKLPGNRCMPYDEYLVYEPRVVRDPCPTCCCCQGYIKQEDLTTAFGRTYHRFCLRCNCCGVKLYGTYAYEMNNQVLCQCCYKGDEQHDHGHGHSYNNY